MPHRRARGPEGTGSQRAVCARGAVRASNPSRDRSASRRRRPPGRVNAEAHAPGIVQSVRAPYANRLAGVYIEHAPTSRLVVRAADGLRRGSAAGVPVRGGSAEGFLRAGRAADLGRAAAAVRQPVPGAGEGRTRLRQRLRGRAHRRDRRVLTKSGTTVGQTVCHYGMGSGVQSCGTVGSKAYNPGSICAGGGTCNAVFVRVDITGNNKCLAADSGGPWFAVAAAAGIHKAGSNVRTDSLCVYTSIDDISGMGVSPL